MSKSRIEELAYEEAINVFPEYKDSNPSYILGIVNNVTDKLLFSHELETIESESRIRELLLDFLKDLRKTMNL